MKKSLVMILMKTSLLKQLLNLAVSIVVEVNGNLKPSEMEVKVDLKPFATNTQNNSCNLWLSIL